MHMAQLMPLPLTVCCFSKSRLVSPFWYRLTWVVPDKAPLNWVCMLLLFAYKDYYNSEAQRSESEAEMVASWLNILTLTRRIGF